MDSGPKDIVVTTTSATDSKGAPGTSYNITNNGFPTGYLNNGKPISKTNITELLDKAKTIWTHGMTWTSPGTTNNNWYINLGTVAKSIPHLHGNNENYQCSAFAVMLSDYLFGKNNNPWTEVTNFSNIHPGVIIMYDAIGIARHVVVATGRHSSGNVFVAEGNCGNVISWLGTGKWDAPSEDSLNNNGSYRAFTCWPQ